MTRKSEMASLNNNLIINADDLGMSVEVNTQIEECINLGVITSSTLMANAPAFDDGVRIAKQYPQISVGVHLNLIEFAPLTNAGIFRKHGLLGDDGSFIEGAIFCASIDDELRQAVFEEWDAQISKVEEAGLKPTHCDSHEHTHTIQGLQEPLCRVLDKHNICRIRRKIIPSIRLMLRGKQQPVKVQLDKSKAVQPKKRNILYRRLHLFVVIISNSRWNRKMASKYSMTKAFYSFRDFRANYNVIRMNNKNVVELMCHPGNSPFQNETELLMKSKNWLSGNYNLIPYHKL